ncbi:HEAT repeat domain-containing protein [Planctomyces sp. SH-PL62]|uniref:HEAT repeat domain-containing protein n=1 Tax=Planctomyces sp. SH-PL62 TaxID=1636152 RepID=UPI0018D4BCC2|nr:HEAT repeat domain-containing protein [Planctomyces sp. SH-PL62]
MVLALALALGSAPPLRAEEAVRADPAIASGATWTQALGEIRADRRYELVVSLAAPSDDDRLAVELAVGDGPSLRKDLHAGDPDVYLPYRPPHDGPATLRLTRPQASSREPLRVHVSWRGDDSSDDDRAALEAEPNDDRRSANRLVLGRDLYGSADDVDYLENLQEGTSGLDWFRFEVDSDRPALVTFTLDLIDRDVSADLRVFTVEAGEPTAHASGEDPMEIIHDRERERYSKNLVRTLERGVYYLRVNANHPAYILRTRVSAVPPFDEPAKAVEAGLHYLLNAGDAWLAQVPREGNRFVRAANLHETSLRCTGCHATSFPADAALATHRAGYSIQARDGLQYLMDRIADSPTPLDGGDLFWQRYIATPLQAQGEQGGLLADYEREVTGEQTAALERFGPFLLAAWASGTTLPEDERNVIPAESKFSLAWRDHKVLTELARRTGREDYAQAAAHIAELTNSRQADRQVETLQDRIHRLVAWSRLDREANANKIRRETGALLALQNEDGGWHESDAEPGPSSVYATGQLVDALLETGITPEHPAIARALKYLLATQQGFGGWFQADTHENFRTPMRETRYAVTALARAFPRPDAPRTSWGNRDDGPARLSRPDSLAHTLDDLENVWEVPEADAPQFVAAIVLLLDHPSPLARASAAACLGRLGRDEGVTPLAKALGDPSKMVRLASATALRRLGLDDRGPAIDAIAGALDSPDPRVRRGVVRVFAYQSRGLAARDELAGRLLARAGDADLLTRFEAVRALRRLFYDTSDASLRARIIETFLARLAAEGVPIMRKNLSENLYIILDENLGGNISLRRNLAALPEDLRARAMEGRMAIERDVLLNPILAALREGSDLQRSGVLQGFDGSFFKGRTYARQPENAVDVGNDREFGFLYEVPLETLDPTFAALIDATRSGAGRRQALQLASFFKVPGRTRDATIQAAVLRALQAPDAETRAEALRIVGDEISFNGAEDDPARVLEIARLIADRPETRPALIAAIGRNPALSRRAEIVAATAALASLPDSAADLLPILDRLGLADDNVFAAIGRGWDGYDVSRKSEAIRVLLRRREARGDAAPPRPLLDLLRKASADSSEAIREQAFSALIEQASENGAGAFPPLLLALADASPKIRRLGLAATASRASFWDRGDAMERLASLLVDPDAGVRSDALDAVKYHRLLIRHPALAPRVRALAGEEALAGRVDALLRASGFDPAAVAPDVAADRPTILSLEAFRRDVNPWFGKPGGDGHSCVDCHASHAILRLAEPRDGGPPTDEDVATNFASALKVVNLARPESSPLLRKPRSPQGRKDDDAAVPEGPTHVGGTRWESDDHPAYRAILKWIRAAEAQTQDVPPFTPAEIEDLSVAPPAP